MRDEPVVGQSNVVADIAIHVDAVGIGANHVVVVAAAIWRVDLQYRVQYLVILMKESTASCCNDY